MLSGGNKILNRIVFRLAFAILPIIFCLTSGAQTLVPGPIIYPVPIQPIHFPDFNQLKESRLANQKWFWTPYAAASIGTAFYPTGNAYMLSAPMGLQLNRQLSKNLYAFGSVFVAPTFTSFGNTFMSPHGYFPSPLSRYQQNYFSVNPGVQMGLMYINDDGTFSISGSVQASTTTFPVPPPPPYIHKR